MLFNINRNPKKYPDGVTWLDVYPEWKEPPTPQTEEEMFAAMMSWTDATKGLAA